MYVATMSRTLNDRRAALRDEHEHAEHGDENQQHEVDRLAVRQVAHGAALDLERAPEAHRDDTVFSLDEQRRDADEID